MSHQMSQTEPIPAELNYNESFHRNCSMNHPHYSAHPKPEIPQSYGTPTVNNVKEELTGSLNKSVENIFLTQSHPPKKTDAEIQTNYEALSKDMDAPHLCFTCGQKFKRKDHLVRHYSIHKGTRFNCSICNKSFSRKDHVKRHMSVHSGEGHPCNICARVFAEKHRLRKHQLTHIK